MRTNLAQTHPRKSKGGFTLIELLIVIVIIAILAGVIIMSIGGVFGNARETAYSTARQQIQNAVMAYSANTSNAGQLPKVANATSGWTSNNLTPTQYVVNVTLLLVSNGGMLRQVPDGIYTSGNATYGISNINLWPAPDGYAGGHYVWLMDQFSTVASICVNTSSSTGNCNAPVGVNGYCGTWP